MRRVVVVACLAVMLGLASHPAAQSPAGPAFEVTSVKPSNPDAPGPRVRPGNGRYFAADVTLRELVLRAYSLYDSMLDGGPDWQRSRRFDIQAKAADSDATVTAMLPMLKTLLADRFKLKVHTERREMPIYALVVARDDGQLSPNITRSTADCSKAEQELAEAGPGAVGSRLLRHARICVLSKGTLLRHEYGSGKLMRRPNAIEPAELAQCLGVKLDHLIDRQVAHDLDGWLGVTSRVDPGDAGDSE